MAHSTDTAIGSSADATAIRSFAEAPRTMNTPSKWTGSELAGLDIAVQRPAPLITDMDVVPIGDLGIWDAWPVQERDGSPAPLKDGRTLWMALGAQRFANPDDRHDHARIHLILREGNRWCHLGPAMPDDFSPGSREWSGSAVLDRQSGTVHLYFTAAGRRGEQTRSFEQRLFAAEASLAESRDGPMLRDWRNLGEIVTRDPRWYMAGDEGGGGAVAGSIKAFRDPAYFADPNDGLEYLFFAGSLAGSRSSFNGAVGAAVRVSGPTGDWRLLPPLVTADGLNNELERPHVIRHAGKYYLFWSTQRHVFDPSGPGGPTGLYGMVSDRLLADWTPLNGSGLVLANPPEAPRQAYSWLVLPDLSVTSFVDQWGIAESSSEPNRFGGSFAPFLKLRLDGSHARLA